MFKVSFSWQMLLIKPIECRWLVAVAGTTTTLACAIFDLLLRACQALIIWFVADSVLPEWLIR